MDVQAAIAEVQDFRRSLPSQTSLLLNGDSVDLTNARMCLYSMRTIATAVDAGFYSFFEDRESAGSLYLSELWESNSAVLEGALRSMDRVAGILGPTGPSANASAFHPWVWHAAVDLWDVGQHQQAVHAAAEAVNRQLRAKIGRNELSGAQLYQEAFSTAEPSESQPRLRSSAVKSTDTDDGKSAHVGALDFGKGCTSLIRNLSAHLDNVDWRANFSLDGDPEQLGLEQLAALSLLARTIDSYSIATQ